MNKILFDAERASTGKLLLKFVFFFAISSFHSMARADLPGDATCYSNNGKTYDSVELNTKSKKYANNIDRILALGNRQVNRADAGAGPEDYVVVDLGGEGGFVYQGLVAGCKDAINLNVRTANSQTGQPIPNLVKLKNWADPYPLGNGFANYIMMQSAPLTDHNVNEIVRMLKPGGVVALWVERRRFINQINTLAKRLRTTPIYDMRDEFNYPAEMRKILIRDRRAASITTITNAILTGGL